MMGKWGYFAFSLLVALSAVRADQAAVPAYTVLKAERCDVNRVTRRISVWVSVPDGLSSNEVMRVMADAVTPHTNLHAVSVFVLREGERPGSGPYTVGLCEWAPYGDWSRASEGTADPQRKTYDVKVDLKPRYFSGKPRPALFGLTAGQTASLAAELEREVLAAQKQVWRLHEVCNPPELKRARAEAIAFVAAQHKLTPAQAEKAWKACTRE
jgi:hypothetical protein